MASLLFFPNRKKAMTKIFALTLVVTLLTRVYNILIADEEK
jgi:hypothetical protein